ASNQQVLFHEYVHYLMSQRSRFNYPRWYAEGLASVLMTTEIGDSILVGNPTAAGALVIAYASRPLSTVHDVVTGRIDNKVDFYVTAWVLSHHVSLGDTN